MSPKFLSYILFSKCRYELKNNHGEWVSTVNPDFDPRMPERVQGALRTTDKDIEQCHSVKTEFRAALSALLGVSLSLSHKYTRVRTIANTNSSTRIYTPGWCRNISQIYSCL